MKVGKIIIFTLDSVISGIALHKIMEAFPERVVLICASQRYGGKYGSFFHQFIKNLRRSGFHFVNYLSFILIYYYPFLFLSDIFNKLFNRQKKVYSVFQLSKKYKVPLVKTREINSPQIVEIIRKVKPDLIISAYFDQVIKRQIIGIPQLGIINIHTALLPSCRGPFPSLCSVLQDKKPGVTIHYVIESLDEGQILRQKEIEMMPNKSILALDCRLFDIGVDLAIQVIKEFEHSAITPLEQKEGEGDYYSFPSREDISKLRKRGVKLFTFKEFINLFI